MKLPGRLFVAGIAPGTGDADIRRHFCRYGEVSDVCQPKDRLTGCHRGFAFVQFPRPIDAGRALAEPHHVINGQQVHVARAKPRIARYKPLCQRIYRCRKRGHYMVGDMISISLGPLGDDYEGCEYVNRLKEFGDIVDNKLTFECCVGYISEDGKECLVRWPPLKKTDGGGGKPALPSAQGDIVPSWTCPMKDFAHFASNGNFGSAHNCRYCLRRRFPGSATCNYQNAVGVGDAPSVESNTKSTCLFPEAGQSQNWCWLVLYAY